MDVHIHNKSIIEVKQTDGEVGISPVLLQAINQKLGSKKGVSAEEINVAYDDTGAIVELPGNVEIIDQGDTIPDDEGQALIVGATEETTQSSIMNESMILTDQDQTIPKDEAHLVIKVIGDGFDDTTRQSITHKLKRLLDRKVIIQMENSQGMMVFEDVVDPSEIIRNEDVGELEESLLNDSDEDVNAIVKSVLDTITNVATGTNNTNSKEHASCPVCGDICTGYHYGVMTCESCKGFFKRTVQNKRRFSCQRGGTCVITQANRKKCPSCRFKKCVESGMKVEGIREDRSRGGRSQYDGASNRVTLDTSLEGTSLVYDSVEGVYKRVSQNIEDAVNSNKRVKLDIDSTTHKHTPARLPYSQPKVPELFQTLLALEQIFEDASESTVQTCCFDKLLTKDKHKFSSFIHMTEHRIFQIVKWARHLPNFLNLETDDQVLLLQHSWAELVTLGYIWSSRFTPGLIQISCGRSINMHMAAEMNLEELFARMIHVCSAFRRMQVDKYEYMALKVICLMQPDVKGLRNTEIVGEFQNKLMTTLQEYSSAVHNTFPAKYQEMLFRISQIRRYTAMMRSAILKRYNTGEITQYGLIMELLRGHGTAVPLLAAASDKDTILTAGDDNDGIITVVTARAHPHYASTDLYSHTTTETVVVTTGEHVVI